MPLTVSIPGKIMLSGEYGVLHGATAVLAPVSRFLLATDMEVADIGDTSPVITAARKQPIREISEFERQKPFPGVTINRDDFFSVDPAGSIRKLGLGSSAAEAVGVIALRFERAGKSWTDFRSEIARYALAAHRQAQGGIGSGADVVCSAMGKPIRFVRTNDDFTADAIDVQPSHAIPLSILWTGIDANTRDLVRGFSNWLDNGGQTAERLLEDLVDAANVLSYLWFNADQQTLFEGLDQFTEAMNAIARTAGMPYRLPIHDEIEAWARKHNGRAKPTGAGGGDMILLVGDLPLEELQQLVIPLSLTRKLYH